MNAGQVTFVVNLLQDINIHRPLVMLAARELKFDTRFLVTTAFRKRDKTGLWQQELNDIANATQSAIHDFGNEYQALQVLQGGHGVLIAASESHLEAHRPVHDLFRIAPSQYVKITLQHGYECVGFLQSRDQNLAHGANITFAADIICGWCAPERLTSITPTQRHKLRVTGPTALLARLDKPQATSLPTADTLERTGLVCENMHSPRLNTAGDFKSEFLDIFAAFSTQLAREGRQITLRPHPGGQYVIKNEVHLPDNVILENAPIYKIDLSRFAYGISAPSSILIDMVLAEIPTAVWRDEFACLDIRTYEGLTIVSSIDQWIEFAHDAMRHPEHYIQKQRRFIENHELIINSDVARSAFRSLLSKLQKPSQVTLSRTYKIPHERILLFSPNIIPTVQLSFIEPLKNLTSQGNVSLDIITETEINLRLKTAIDKNSLFEWLIRRVVDFRPTAVIFCRWAAKDTGAIVDFLRSMPFPMIFHLDDDLLNVPKEIDEKKWEYHNQTYRLESIRTLLDNSDLVYCSTNKLKERLLELGAKATLRSGKIVCSGRPLVKPKVKPITTVGYMGIGHAEDLAHVLPAIIGFLKKHQNITFDFFGTIPLPAELSIFGDRIRKVPKIENYNEFMHYFSRLEWDIGICPLAPLKFNRYKANNKWVEYTSIGAAVIASKGFIYEDCCSDNCGILANSVDEWSEALELLTSNPEYRANMVISAQKKLIKEYSPSQLCEQVLAIIKDARIEKSMRALNAQ